MDQQVDRQRLRAPRADGRALLVPTLDEVPALIEHNVRRRAAYDYDFGGRSLAQLSDSGRTELVREARRYTAQYRDLPNADGGQVESRLFLAGHQPTLFHPGVWLKNIALGRLAADHGAIGVNLLIDSDTIKTTSLRVPSGSVAHPVVESVPFDQPSGEVPYEDRPVLDGDLFRSFGRRVQQTIRPLVPDPLIEEYWPLAVGRMEAGAPLGLCLAQSRHQLEGDWGLATLELPQSRVCQLEAFHWFAAHVIAQLPRFWEIYNSALADYRRLNRLRSRTHPVPDLVAVDTWLEAPFWIWHRDDPRRQRLFVQARGDRIVLSDRGQLEISLDLTSEGIADRAVETLAELGQRGIKLRTRALATTMFARLILGDLFLHGIGGAKYDLLTDLFIRRFFGLEPPGFMTISATLHLPIQRRRISPQALRDIAGTRRELQFHPERRLDRSSARTPHDQSRIDELVATKRRWVQTPKTHQNARRRHLEITRANHAMQAWLSDARRRLDQERAELDALARIEAILTSREYAFCLYPKKTLQSFLLELLAPTA